MDKKKAKDPEPEEQPEPVEPEAEKAAPTTFELQFPLADK